MVKARKAITKHLVLVVFIVLGNAAYGQVTTTSTATLDSLQAVIVAGEYDRAVTESEVVLVRWEREFGANSLEVAQVMDKVAAAYSREHSPSIAIACNGVNLTLLCPRWRASCVGTGRRNIPLC